VYACVNSDPLTIQDIGGNNCLITIGLDGDDFSAEYPCDL